MKLSTLTEEQLSQLTVQQVTEIVYGDWQDDGESYDVALLLGGKAFVCRERAEAAAHLWHTGRVKYIVPTGGVKWETELGEISESTLLRHYLLELGVPEEAILQEDEASTTVENMLYSTILMQRVLRIKNVRKLAVVTSPCHLRRSLLHANNYLPRPVEVHGFALAKTPDNRTDWNGDTVQQKRTHRELRLLWQLVQTGIVPDVEF